jgi:putative tryptophan/tyrosine transport system substrate-binding protein
MERREFISLVGGTAAVWPFAARAQQRSVPVIGFIHRRSRDGYAPRSGKSGAKPARGRDVAIEYR